MQYLKKPLIILTVLILLVLLCFIIGVSVFNYLKSPAGNNNEEVNFTVEKGWSHSEVARKLNQEGFIKNWFFYTLYIRLFYTKEREKELESEILKKALETGRQMTEAEAKAEAKRKAVVNVYPGSFKLRKNMDIEEIIAILDTPPMKPQIEVTIKEGSTSFDIADLLSQEIKIDRNKFIRLINDRIFIDKTLQEYQIKVTNLEGLLFPETYKFSEGYEEEKIIKKMVDTFFHRFEEEICPINKIKEKLKNIEPMSFQDMLTLASLVEKETASDKERELISGVYFNRIKTRGWVLNADPTVIYGLKLADRWNEDFKTSLGLTPEGNINWKSFNSQYNTYIKEGLPPTPIANPGMQSIKAALNPKQTEYFFFVAKNDGTKEHYFAVTLAEHNNNIQKSNKNSPN